MTKNNAAQPGLTESALEDLEKQVQRDIPRFGPNVHIGVRAGLLREMLSKLRAPVADDLPHWEEISAKLERDETLTPLESFIHENEPAGSDDADAWRDQLAAALASAPVANGITPAGMKEICPACGHQFACFHSPYIDELRALRASAPVAGEAQPVALYQARTRPTWRTDENAWSNWKDCTAEQAADYERVPLLHDWQHEVRRLYAEPQASASVRIGRATTKGGRVQSYAFEQTDLPDGEHTLTVAAPQASEAVRDGKWPMLAELHLHALMFAYNEGYSKAYDGRVFPNPFSENGSQAAAWQLGTDDGTEARAALSAQPAAQRTGGSDGQD